MILQLFDGLFVQLIDAPDNTRDRYKAVMKEFFKMAEKRTDALADRLAKLKKLAAATM